jgi:hypothetical protein
VGTSAPLTAPSDARFGVCPGHSFRRPAAPSGPFGHLVGRRRIIPATGPLLARRCVERCQQANVRLDQDRPTRRKCGARTAISTLRFGKDDLRRMPCRNTSVAASIGPPRRSMPFGINGMDIMFPVTSERSRDGGGPPSADGAWDSWSSTSMPASPPRRPAYCRQAPRADRPASG